MSDNDNGYFSFEARQARRARRLASFDGIKGSGEGVGGRLTTQNAGQHAVQMAREVLDNFLLPTMPKLSYSGIRNAKTATSSSRLEDGVITIFAEMKTLSGVVVGFDIPMEIRAGELMEPSVIVVQGAPRIIAQSSFDDMVDRGTVWDQPPVRELYSAPLSNGTAKELYGNRTKQKRVNPGMFSLGANRQALKDAIAGRSVTAQLETTDHEAQMDGGAVGPDEHAMNLRINDLSHQMDFGIGDKSRHMLELQKLVKDRDNLRKQVSPNGPKPIMDGPRSAQNKVPTSPTIPIPKVRKPRQYDPMESDETQTMRDEDWTVLKNKMNPLPIGGDEPETSVDIPAVGNNRGIDPTILSPAPHTTQQMLPPSVRNTKQDTNLPSMQPTQKVSPVGQLPTMSERGVPRAKGGAVEDYDADDKHEKPDHDRNTQEDDWLDPAERDTNDIHAGQKVSLKEALEFKDRGGGVFDIAKGTKCLVVRDHAGDNKSFVVRFDDGKEVIVERRFLGKTAAVVRTAAQRANDSVLVETEYVVDHPLADVPGVFLAGGAIRDFIRGRTPKDYDYFFSDMDTHNACVDMFLDDGADLLDGSEMATRLMHNGSMYELVHGRLFSSLEEALDSFDLTACMVGTKGRKVYATKIGLDDLTAEIIRPWNIWHLPITHMRVAKLVDTHGFRDPFGVRDAIAKKAVELGFSLVANVVSPTPYELSIGISAASVIANRNASAIAAQMTPYQQSMGMNPTSAVHPLFFNGSVMPVLDPVTGRWIRKNYVRGTPLSCIAPPHMSSPKVQMTPGGPMVCEYQGCTGSCINAQRPRNPAASALAGQTQDPVDQIDMPQETMGKPWPEAQIMLKMREYKNGLGLPVDQAVQKIIQDGCSGTPTPAPDEVKYLQTIYKTAQYIPAPEDGMPTVEEQKEDMEDNEPVSLVADMDFIAKVTNEVQSMADQGITEIDAKSAVLHKYGPEIAAKIFE